MSERPVEYLTAAHGGTTAKDRIYLHMIDAELAVFGLSPAIYPPAEILKWMRGSHAHRLEDLWPGELRSRILDACRFIAASDPETARQLDRTLRRSAAAREYWQSAEW